VAFFEDALAAARGVRKSATGERKRKLSFGGFAVIIRAVISSSARANATTMLGADE